ncbi:MAG: protein translocase subunit SecF [Candidatus Wildermuthbacteria bacterium]|nr:protein translocase subunit SecF [Candidatus Wildermuthbacteria bacterium]
MSILRYSNFYFFLSAFLIVACVGVIFLFGLQLGIEFTGGSILEVEYDGNVPAPTELRGNLSELQLESLQIQNSGERGMIVRMKTIPEETHAKILETLGAGVKELRFESIGPVIGRELREKTFIIVGLSLIIIAAYIAFAFRRITQPLKSWQWSFVAFLGLLHDLFIPLGVFAVLGEFRNQEFSIPVVVALLTVLGYSINNNIVVFDRVRENLTKRVGIDFADTVERSIKQTFTRNLNTSLTTLIPLFAIFFLGGETLQGFTLALIIGIMVGFYSSLFFAPAFLVRYFGRRKNP